MPLLPSSRPRRAIALLVAKFVSLFLGGAGRPGARRRPAVLAKAVPSTRATLVRLLVVCLLATGLPILAATVAPVPPVGADLSSDYRDLVLSQGPAAYWRFDDSPGSLIASDSGPNGLDAAVLPDGIPAAECEAKFVGTGPLGAYQDPVHRSSPAGDFGECGNDPNGQVTLPTDTRLRPTDALTVTTWVEPHNCDTGLLIGDTSYPDSGIDSGYKLFMSRVGSNNAQCFPSAIVDGVWISGANIRFPSGCPTCLPHHIALVKDASTISLWVDGALDTIVPHTSAIHYDASSTYSRNCIGCGYQGTAAETAIFDRALSSAEIQAQVTAAGFPLAVSRLSAFDLLGGSNPMVPCFSCAVDRLVKFGYPVDSASGNFWHTFNELGIPGRGPDLAFSLTYNSLEAGASSLAGYGWRHNYDMSLTIGAGDTPVTVTQENGSQVEFNLTSGSYVAAPRVQGSLTHNGDGTWTLERNRREEFVFNSDGQLVELADLNGYSVTLSYSTGRLSTATDSSGRTLTFAYSGGRLTSVEDDTASRTVQLDYSGSGDLTSITDVGGKVTTLTYDGSHRVLQMLDPNQQSAGVKHYLTNVYTGGKVTSQTDLEGRETTFDYTSIPGATEITDPMGTVIVEEMTGGFPTRITRGYGTSSAATWSIAYDPALGMPIEVLDPNGHKTTNTYDDRGNLLEQRSGMDVVLDPDGHLRSWEYNDRNSILSVQDSNGVVTNYTYDDAENLTSVSTPISTHSGTYAAATYAYTDGSHPGDVTSMTDPRGKIWQYAYDTYGLRATVTDPTSKVTQSCYDTVGRRTRLITPKGVAASVTCTSSSPTYTTLYTTNAYGDVLTTTDALGHQSVMTYDDNRNLKTSQDANGHQTSYDYNRDNEVVNIDRPSATDLATDYWADGSLKSQTDGNGQTTAYTYDPLGHLSTITDPLGRVTTYTSDAVGNQLTKQDNGGSCATVPGTGCTRYSYDSKDQLTGITYSDGTTPAVTYAYDDDGQRIAMTDGTGNSTWTWDSVHRLTASTDGASQAMAYDYDSAGNQTSVTYPGTKTVTRSYDDAGRLSWTKDWFSPMHQTSYSYDDNSNLTGQTDPNSTTVTYTADAADRLMGITHTRSATTLASFTYTRDDANLLSGVSSSVVGTNESYTHNTINQLTQVNSATYTYDNADNLTKLADGTLQRYDIANQLCYQSATNNTAACTTPPADAITYGYDSRGNRTSKTYPATGTWTYGYDQANRLTAAATIPKITSVSGATGHNVALRSDGTVWTWGLNTNGQLGDGTTTNSNVPIQVPGITNAIAVAAGGNHTLALLADGTVAPGGSTPTASSGTTRPPNPTSR